MTVEKVVRFGAWLDPAFSSTERRQRRHIDKGRACGYRTHAAFVSGLTPAAYGASPTKERLAGPLNAGRRGAPSRRRAAAGS